MNEIGSKLQCRFQRSDNRFCVASPKTQLGEQDDRLDVVRRDGNRLVQLGDRLIRILRLKVGQRELVLNYGIIRVCLDDVLEYSGCLF